MRGVRYVKREKKENGISMGHEIRITSLDGNRNHFAHLMFHLCFIMASVLAILYSWFDGLDLKLDHQMFLMGLFITTLFYIAFQELNKLRWYLVLFYLTFIGGACYHYWAFIQNGFYALENAIIAKASVYYGLNPVRFVVYENETRSTTFLFLLIAQVITFIVSVEVYQHYMRSIYLFCILLFYGTLLALGVVPPAFWLLFTIAIYLSMKTMDHIPNGLKSGLFKHGKVRQEISTNGKQRIRIQSALAILTFFIIAYLIVWLVIPQETYDEKIDFTDRKIEIQKQMREFSIAEFVEDVKKEWNEVNPFQSNKRKQSVGLDSGRLGDVGTVSYTGEIALTVTLDQKASYLYLKGFAGAKYKTDEWANVSEQEEQEYQDILDTYGVDRFHGETLLWEWMNMVEEANMESKDTLLGELGLNKEEVFVTYQNANDKFLYAPYVNNYSLFSTLNTVADQYVLPLKLPKENYMFMDTYVAFNGSDLNELLLKVYETNLESKLPNDYNYQEFLAFEKAYRNYVHKVYTRLPEKGLERLRQVSFDTGSGGLEDKVWLILQVIEYIHENTEYSLSPGIAPNGVDFAEYFLFDVKKGYCSHYATAATLLLRNYGIPARYVEGYVITTQDIETGNQQDDTSVVDVRDYNAHAWVEVYFDSVGWIPIEVTDGYSLEGVSNLLNQIQDKKDEKEEKVTEEAPKPTFTPIPTQSPVGKITNTPTKAVEKPIAQHSDQEGTTSHIITISILIAIVVSIGGLVVRYLFKYRKLMNKITANDLRKQVIGCYLQVEKLLRECGVHRQVTDTFEVFANRAQEECNLLPKGFQEMVELVLKAQFSNETIQQEEASKMLQYYLKLRVNYEQNLSGIKRFWFKFWKVI